MFFIHTCDCKIYYINAVTQKDLERFLLYGRENILNITYNCQDDTILIAIVNTNIWNVYEYNKNRSTEEYLNTFRDYLKSSLIDRLQCNTFEFCPRIFTDEQKHLSCLNVHTNPKRIFIDLTGTKILILGEVLKKYKRVEMKVFSIIHNFYV